VGVVWLVANQLTSWLTLNFGVKYHVGKCICGAADGTSTAMRTVLVVEGGTPLTALSAARTALTWVLGRVLKSIRVLGLTGMALGDIIFVRSGMVDVEWLMAHECGHTEQARIYGPFYIPLVGLFTILGGWPTSYFEEQATRLGRGFKKLRDER